MIEDRDHFFHSTSLIYAMLGTKDCEKEGDCIIPTRIPSSAVETGQCPSDSGDTPAGEKGWSEGPEGSEKGVERDEKVSQRWDILRGGGSSGRGNSMGLESKLESTGHGWATSSKAYTLSGVEEKMPPPEIFTSQSLEPETMSRYVAKGN